MTDTPTPQSLALSGEQIEDLRVAAAELVEASRRLEVPSWDSIYGAREFWRKHKAVVDALVETAAATPNPESEEG